MADDNRDEIYAETIDAARAGEKLATRKLRKVFSSAIVDFATTRGVATPHTFANSVLDHCLNDASNLEGGFGDLAHAVSRTACEQLRESDSTPTLELSFEQEVVMMMRVFLGLSQAETAKAAGLSEDRTQQLEDETRMELARFLNGSHSEDPEIPPSFFLDREVPKPVEINRIEHPSRSTSALEPFVVDEETSHERRRKRLLAMLALSACVLAFIVGVLFLGSEEPNEQAATVLDSATSTSTASSASEKLPWSYSFEGPTQIPSLTNPTTDTTATTSFDADTATTRLISSQEVVAGPITRPTTTTSTATTTTGAKESTSLQTPLTVKATTASTALTSKEPASFAATVKQASGVTAHWVEFSLSNGSNVYRANTTTTSSITFKSIPAGCYRLSNSADDYSTQICLDGGEAVTAPTITLSELTPAPMSCTVEKSAPASSAGVRIEDSPFEYSYVFLNAKSQWVANTVLFGNNYTTNSEKLPWQTLATTREWGGAVNNFPLQTVVYAQTINIHGRSNPIKCYII